MMNGRTLCRGMGSILKVRSLLMYRTPTCLRMNTNYIIICLSGAYRIFTCITCTYTCIYECTCNKQIVDDPKLSIPNFLLALFFSESS